MEIREILKRLREKRGLTQEQLAEKVMVTRQAVSRWENGETQPSTDTLKLLSRQVVNQDVCHGMHWPKYVSLAWRKLFILWIRRYCVLASRI